MCMHENTPENHEICTLTEKHPVVQRFILIVCIIHVQ